MAKPPKLTALPGGKATTPPKGTCQACGRVVVLKRDGTPRKHGCKPTTKTVSQAAADGDRRGLLVAMRDRIAEAVDSPKTPPRDLAALMRRLQEIGADIEAIDAAARQEAREQESVADEEWDGSTI